MSNHDDGCGAVTDSDSDSGTAGVRTSGGRNRFLVLAFATITLMLGTWGACSWSLIPLDVHGRINRIVYQSDSGYRWRILELDDGRSFVIDRRITGQLGHWQALRGQRVDTDSGSHTLRVGNTSAHLAPSVEFWKILFTFAALATFALVRTRIRAAWPPSATQPLGRI